MTKFDHVELPQIHRQAVVLPALLLLPLGITADPEKSLMEAMRPEMLRLIGNLMSNNLQCVITQRKLTVWRTAFSHNATGALRYVLAQVFSLLQITNL